MLRVGLTGGIGAGKSTVAARLAELGATVIDADRIAREVVEPGTDGLAEVVETFGEDVLTPEGELDRAALAAKAFADDESRARLNAITHPRIGRRTVELMGQATADAIVVHDVPLLVEGGMGANYHLVLVVDADEDLRVRRLGESRGMDAEDARARIAAQATREQRAAAADVWLDNSGTADLVQAQVDALWNERLVPFEANVRRRRPRAPKPPALVEPDPTWPAQAERLLSRVRAAAGDKAVRADHIGSTAVPGLVAKDTLDLQLTVRSLDEADLISEALSDAGFVRAEGHWFDQPQDEATAPARWDKRFHYGADPQRPVNLHVRSAEGPAWRLALLFRDWLQANPAEARVYADIKQRLARAHAGDASSLNYSEEKQSWVDAAFVRAERWAVETGWEV
ncbi:MULTISPECIES: dephospho-CoA kinase [Prauserella salsuginis group]|uniref:Dephospho-CoA kinase n=1 Tax=Prauserella salsuginis TaxID=387889 RepID=A0ABW6GC14_9PSEU|nr:MULTISPECIES: dephospho-CoA kinase [Prauserella salsuginis group]MCR3722294.1 dephospho-CoA kinase [Prauserella flava]MCR3736292.1 dephospho-CoA kinase [Prauserella salsuginis]